jgi:glyoxylase-like metal-dependent hydrolase (beta-lactamase superfamily II)
LFGRIFFTQTGIHFARKCSIGQAMSPAPLPALSFPFAAPPAPGAALEVAPGLFWARLPLPLALDHVNVWIADDGDGWTVVDCGIDTQDARAIWQALQGDALAGKPIRRLIVTHAHPDHIGMARPLVDGLSIPLVATRTEYEAARRMRQDASRGVPPEQAAFLVAHGYPREAAQTRSGFARIVNPLTPDPPPLAAVIADGETVRFGARDWRVIVAGGHAPEHASFYDPAGRILIAGDQILPRITPFVGVGFREPNADPLRLYLESLALFEDLPDETLVLPGHGLPFYGLPARLKELRDHHDRRLDEVVGALKPPLHAYDMAQRLFPRAMGTGHERLAVAETIAHLNYLLHRGRVARRADPRGVLMFEQV